MNKLRLEGRFAHLKPARLLLFVIAVLAGWLYPASLVAAATLNYVQGNSAVPQTPQTTVNVTFTAAQAAGDLNVVVVGWNDTTATVSSVADKSGNAYTLAVGPTAFTGVLSQSIYYAKNIKSAAAAANIVTVTFSPAAAYPDIRILEYNGADLNSPVDVTAANTGNSSTTTSGSATTTNATDLLLGASMVATFTTGPGTGFTSRLLTSPDGDIAEDRMVTATGSYSATTAALSPAGPWVMQMVAFRTPLGSVVSPTAPGNLTATAAGPVQINLSWTASTETGGTISQYLIERCTGATCSNFLQVGTSPTTTFNDTGLLGSTTYSYRVRATDASNNFSAYSNTASATTAAPTFTAPSNLTATAASSTQINLSWTAATETGGTIIQYLIERCQGSGCSSFAQVATSITSTFNDTGLLAGTTYSYRVRATDAASNLSPYSNVASATTLSTSATLSYVQGNSAVPQTSQTTVNVTFTAAQAAGDLNVVVVGWNDTTATVSSVADKSGNTYTLAVGPTAFTGVLSQSIYYAKNIKSAAAAANIVTVTFSPAAAYPDIRILEYNGADLNSPVDVTAANTGNGSTTNSGSATTTNATDLLLGASMVATFTTGPGTGFTSRLLTSPDGDIAEDRMVTATGSYSATTATLSPAGPWVMQMVAFRTPLGSVAPPTAPGNLTATAASTTQINLSWTASTSTIGIANYVVQRCQGAGCTNFAPVATPIGTTYSSTGLLASATYSYR